jgi:MFS family permease
METDSPSHQGWTRGTASVLGIGIAATTVVALPTLLVGGLAVLMQRDLRFGASELGAAIAIAFFVAALAAIPAGRLADRLGPKRTTSIGLACALVALLGLGTVVNDWIQLAVCLSFAGAAITTVQLGVNVLLARRIPPGQQGLAFGIKQAAVPMASLIAGLALPLIGLTVGWRAAFLLAAACIPLLLWLVPDARAGRSAATTHEAAGVPLRPLLLLGVGMALASAGGNSTPAFIVSSAVDRGLAPAGAGLVLAGGSVVGILVRVLAGWLGDYLGRGSLLLVAGLVSIGAVGFVGLSLADDPALIAIFAALAFGGGWGWGGLTLLALSRISPGAPGRAMGIVQIGPMSGAVLGPLVFGGLAERVSFGAAWSTMAVLAVLGVATILLSRPLLLRHRRSG